jgi:autotransporter-associated beta strand protein
MGALLTTASVDAADALIGRWLSGSQDLTDSSGFTLLGTHNGVAVGSNAGSLAWSTDVPVGFPSGYSVDLAANNVAVQIANTATDDVSYQNTFDEGISTKFTGTFWFKGATTGNLAGTWFGKSGNTPLGWKSRPLDTPTHVDFTMRNNSGESVPSSMTSIPTQYTDGAWHHVALVFDGTASYRKLYVDGVLQKQVTGTAYSVTFAPGSHLVIGGNQPNTVGSAISSFFTGKMYDVRMYNYALTAGQVTDVFNPPALPSSKELSLFTFPGIGNATISGNNISMTVPFSTDVSALSPTFVHTGASASPVSGSTQNFTSPKTYTITAGNATSLSYSVTVSKAPISAACDILSSALGSYSSSIVGTKVTLYVPLGTDVTNLSPTFTTPPYASIFPLSGSPHDFSSPVNYTVTAENGVTTKTYTVTVAQTNFWVNSTSGETWTTAGNWDSAIVPTSGNTTVLGFKTAGAYASTHDLGAGFLVNQLLLSGPTLSLDGESLRFSGITPQVVQASDTAVAISNDLDISSTLTLGGAGTGTVTLNGLISGGSLQQQNRGTLYLNHANTYIGGTTISSGALTVGNQNALGTGTVTLAGGTTLQQVNFEGFGLGGVISNNVSLSGGMVNLFVSFGLSKDLWLGGVVSGTGGLHIYGNQRGVTLSNDNSFSGGVTVDGHPTGIQVNVTHVNGLGTGPLSLTLGAKAQLGYAGDHVINSLIINGVVQPNGTYGSSASDAVTVDDTYFSGTGTITVGPHKQATIRTFVFDELPAAVIDQVNHTIKLTVPTGTDVTGLAPTYTLSTGASCTPGSGATVDFSTPQSYTVTAEDGVTQSVYVVSVTVAVTSPLVTIAAISKPVAGPGVGEFTVTIGGSSNFVGNVVIEKSTNLVDWSIAQTTAVSEGNFSIPIVLTESAPKAFFRVKYP